MSKEKMLCQRLIGKRGPVKRIRWFEGKRLDGKIISSEDTWSGKTETRVEDTVVKASGKFRVRENE